MKTVLVVVSLSALAGIAHAQGGAPQPGETAAPAAAPEYDRPVLARNYANGFGRRLANTILLFIDRRTVLRNLPLLGYGLDNVRNACASGPAPAPAIGGEVALVHEAYKAGRYFGPKFDFPASKVPWEAVCGWLDDPRDIFERSGLYAFDIMGRAGKWTFAGEGAPPEGRQPFLAGRMERGPFGARGDFVRWTVEPGGEQADAPWTLAWTAPGADAAPAAKANLRWRYETVSPLFAAGASADVAAASGFAASVYSFLYGAAVDSPAPTVEPSSASAISYYMSYSAAASVLGSGMISKCGIGAAGAAPCSMRWHEPPVPDPGEEAGDFYLWRDAGRQAEIGADWYLLTGEPLLAGSADIWVERSAFR